MAWARCRECEQIGNVQSLRATTPEGNVVNLDERCLECRDALRDTLTKMGFTDIHVPVR